MRLTSYLSPHWGLFPSRSRANISFIDAIRSSRIVIYHKQELHSTHLVHSEKTCRLSVADSNRTIKPNSLTSELVRGIADVIIYREYGCPQAATLMPFRSLRTTVLRAGAGALHFLRRFNEIHSDIVAY